MSYTPDFTLPGVEHLLRLINQTNSKAYTQAEVYFDPPQPTNLQIGPNTRVIMRAIPGAGYKSSVELTYNRLDINQVFTGNLDLSMIETNDLATIRAQVLSQYGFNLTASDVELIQFNDLPALRALPDSYIVTGQVTVQMIAPTTSPLQITGFDGEPLTGFDGEPLLYYAQAV